MPEQKFVWTEGLDVSAVDSPTAGKPAPLTPSTAVFGTSEFESLLTRTRGWLTDDGYDQETIDSLLSPYKVGSPAAPIDLSRLYNTVSTRLSDEDVTSLLETLKIQQSIEEDGGQIGPFELSALRTALGEYTKAIGPKAVENLVESRTWWNRTKRNLSQKVGDLVMNPNVSTGLALLDWASKWQREDKIRFAPEHRKADLRTRMLPKIALQVAPEKEFDTGSSAAIELIKQRMYGATEWLGGMPAVVAGKVLRNKGLEEVGQMTMKRGEQRYKLAREEAPQLLATLGEHIPWSEALAESDEAIDAEYMYWNNAGAGGTAAMYSRAWGDQISDIFADRLFLLSWAPVKLVQGARALRPLAKQLTSAEQFAIRTRDARDILNSVAKSEEFLAKSRQAMEANAVKFGGRVQKSDLWRVLNAENHVAENEKLLQQSFDEAENLYKEVYFFEAARRDPALVPVAEKVAKEYKITSEQAVDLTNNRIKSLKIGPVTNDNYMEMEEAAFHSRYILGPDDGEQIGNALEHITRTGGLGIDDVALTPMSAEYRIPREFSLPTMRFDKADNLAGIDKVEKEILKTVSKDVPENTKGIIRTLARHETLMRKNLGAARSSGDKQAIQFYELGVKNLQKTRAELNLKELSGAMEEFAKDVDGWLPPLMQGPLDSPSAYHRWLESMGNTVSRGLQIGSISKTNPISRLAGAHNSFWRPWREPQRLLTKYSPETWAYVRSHELMYQQASHAYNEHVTRILERCGVFEDLGEEFNPSKHFASHKINEERSNTLFKLLDTTEFFEIEELEQTGIKEAKELAAALGTKSHTKDYTEILKKADEPLLKARDEIRDLLANFADELGLPTEKRITAYAPHFHKHEWTANGARPPEFDGMRLSASVYFGNLETRTGAKGFSTNVPEILDFYGRGAFRKIYKEPMYEKMLQSGDDMAAATGRPVFQDYMYDWVADLKGRPNFLGKKMDRMFADDIYNLQSGRKAWRPSHQDRVLTGLTGLMWAGALVGNVRYPVMQIATGIITTASRYGLFRTTRAMFEMATPEGRALAKKIGTADSFKYIHESDKWSQAFEKMSKLGISQTESFIRGTSALASVDLYLTKFGFSSWDDAVRAGADKMIMFSSLRGAEETNHLFGPFGRPAYPSRSLLPNKALGTAATQFLSFVPKQLEELNAQFGRNPGRLAQYLMLSGWVSRVAAEEMGIDLTNYVGLGFTPTTAEEVSAPAVTVFSDMINFLNAASNRDPVRTQKYAEEFLTSLQLAIPTMNLYQTASRNAERIIDKEVKNKEGERLRGIDFGRVPGSSLGPEIVSLVTGQQSMADKIFRTGMEDIYRIKLKRTYDAGKLLTHIGDAFSDKDFSKMKELETKLVSEYGVELVGKNAGDRAAEARYISSIIREIKHNKKLAPLFIEAAEKHGIRLLP